MSTTGAFTFQLAPSAKEGIVEDENTIGRGEWGWIDRTGDFGDSKKHLMIYARCPDCGILSTLWREGSPPGHSHEIGATGLVSPSIQCPHQGCGFHTQPSTLAGFVELRK